MRREPVNGGAAAAGLLTILAANLLYLSGLGSILDPMMSMEPLYIQMAGRPLAGIVGEDPGFGPLFALWLKPFVAAFGDPMAVYLANIYALSVALSVLIYLHLLLLTRRVAAAVGGALFFLISDFNVPLAGKISAFALVVVLAGLTAAALAPSGSRRLSVAAAGVLLAAHARPELYPAAVCLALGALWLAVGERHDRGWRVLLWPATVVAAIVALAFTIGTPLFSPDHDNARLLIALREHFAWNWSHWHGESGYFLAIWEREFGDAQGPLQAFLTNPTAFAHHLADNLRATIQFMLGSAFAHYPLLAPATRPVLVQAENLIAWIAVCGSVIAVALRREWRRSMIDRYADVLVPYAVVAACSIGAATLIYPLARYLIFAGVLLMITGAMAAAEIFPARPPMSWIRRLAAAAVCLAAVPRPFVLPSAYEVAGSPFKGGISVTRPVADTIAFIRSLGLPPPVHVLTLTDGVGEMLGAGFEEVKVWQKGAQPLEDYLRDRHVDVIVTLHAGRDSFFFDDAYWATVHDQPEAAGFMRLSVPGHDEVRVLVRSDLVQ